MTRPTLRDLVVFRHEAARATRAWFERNGFLEVSAPTLVESPGMELHLRAFPVSAVEATELGDRFLHTSPELAIKSALAEVGEDVYFFGRCYRDEPPTRWHHAEFDMLEWYRLDAPLDQLMRDVESLFAHLYDALGRGRPLRAPGFDGPLDSTAPFARISVRDAFVRHAGVDPLEADRDELAAAAHAADLVDSDAAGWDWSGLFTLLYAERIEPTLGFPRPTFLTDFPASQAALAALSPNDRRVAQRFELYVGGRWERAPYRGGIELANAFYELTDAAEQRRRFEAERAQRARLGRAVYPLPERMLSGLRALDSAAGIALGFDRLVAWFAEALEGWELSVADLRLAEPLGRS